MSFACVMVVNSLLSGRFAPVDLLIQLYIQLCWTWTSIIGLLISTYNVAYLPISVQTLYWSGPYSRFGGYHICQNFYCCSQFEFLVSLYVFVHFSHCENVYSLASWRFHDLANIATCERLEDCIVTPLLAFNHYAVVDSRRFTADSRLDRWVLEFSRPVPLTQRIAIIA